MSGRPDRRRPPHTTPRRDWGWHRLDDALARELVALSGIGRGDLVLDLGAGEGAITRPLLDSGARVVAFELHPDRVAVLRRSFGDRARVVCADVTDLRLPRQPFRVVANPPFDGVSSVLDRLTHRASRLERAHLVVPVSVADRWSRRLASDRSGHGFELGTVRRVPRSAFRPRPRIDTCIVMITPRHRR